VNLRRSIASALTIVAASAGLVFSSAGSASAAADPYRTCSPGNSSLGYVTTYYRINFYSLDPKSGHGDIYAELCGKNGLNTIYKYTRSGNKGSWQQFSSGVKDFALYRSGNNVVAYAGFPSTISTTTQFRHADNFRKFAGITNVTYYGRKMIGVVYTTTSGVTNTVFF
jgi:hypothetical protein